MLSDLENVTKLEVLHLPDLNRQSLLLPLSKGACGNHVLPGNMRVYKGNGDVLSFSFNLRMFSHVW